MESIFEVPNSMIKKALEEYVPENNRALKWWRRGLTRLF
jgi:hypothetical protein